MVNEPKVHHAIKLLLQAIGEDPTRPGLKDTPNRVAKLYAELLSGNDAQAKDILKVIHDVRHDDMIILKKIPFYSLCEHHLLPFFGHCHVAYIPKQNRVVGLSKIARLVEAFSRRLQLQERLTTSIAQTLMHTLKPKGVAVVIKARHLCLEARGVHKPGVQVITSSVKGLFRDDPKTRQEFFQLI